MHCTHSIAFCISPTAWHACRLPHSLPGHVQAFTVHINSKPAKRTFIVQVRSCFQQASRNQGRMHPTLQVRTDQLPGPHPGIIDAASRTYTQQAFN